MTAIIERLVRKDLGDNSSPKVAQRYALLCSAAGIALNLLLFGGKLLAAGFSGSVALAADAFNNLADAGTCAAELLGFVVAGFGAGEIHPFGHGRVEWLMGLFASILVLFMGGEMARSSIAAIRSPAALAYHPWSLVVLVVSIAVKFFMYRYNKSIGAKISSVAMKAKAYDCLGDMAATTAVLLSTLAVHFLGWQIDGWCGVAVSLFILYAGLQALKEAAGPLMGSAPDHALAAAIGDMCAADPRIAGVYELMVHDYGFQRRMVSFHIAGEGDAAALVQAAGDLSGRLRGETGCVATIQVEQLAHGGQAGRALLASIEEAVGRVDPAITIRHFRLVQQTGRVAATMDAVVPPQLVKLESPILEAVAGAVHQADNRMAVDAKVKMSATANRFQIKK